MDTNATTPTQPSEAVRDAWPDVSGNAINGLGEAERAPPRPVFWRTDGSIPHEDVMYYFYERYRDNERIAAARKYREETRAIEVSDIAAEKVERSAADWTGQVKAAALDLGADDAGICAFRPEWTFSDRKLPQGQWAIVLGFGHDYGNMENAPSEDAYIEVMDQYGRAGGTAKRLANWIRARGHGAEAKTGPMTEDVLMIPAAIAAGLGELGKHGSMIHKQLGSSFRLSMVTTSLPLLPDAPEIFGADMFCASCQICANACPPDPRHARAALRRHPRHGLGDP